MIIIIIDILIHNLFFIINFRNKDLFNSIFLIFVYSYVVMYIHTGRTIMDYVEHYLYLHLAELSIFFCFFVGRMFCVTTCWLILSVAYNSGSHLTFPYTYKIRGEKVQTYFNQTTLLFIFSLFYSLRKEK